MSAETTEDPGVKELEEARAFSIQPPRVDVLAETIGEELSQATPDIQAVIFNAFAKDVEHWNMHTEFSWARECSLIAVHMTPEQRARVLRILGTLVTHLADGPPSSKD